MNNISYKRLGVAFGLTGAIFYLGCMILMVAVGKSGTVAFFNSVLHGLDIEPIIKMNVHFLHAAIGLVLTFILGWISGASVAGFYNASGKIG
ncbi:MAG: hypothetical protein ACI8ZM_005504 [Crocinitomix sp.]|jgi:hypothetical protein